MYSLQGLTDVARWRRVLVWGTLVLPLLLPQPALSQSKRPSTGQSKGSSASKKSTPQAQADSSSAGTISGTVTDQAGSVAVGAQIELTSDANSSKQKATSGDNGEYSFTNVPAGPFHLTVSAPGFDTKIYSGTVQVGQTFLVPAIALSITAVTAEVSVELTPVEVAEEQVKVQEQQRVLGFIPNFYVSYVPDAAPLIPRQKFQLAFKSVTDPITILGAGFLAGLYQAADQFPGYGQGAEGYAKRFGAAYADVVVGTFVGSAALPSLLKQDPRYFYKGTGTTRSRLMYAIANAVICKGDNKKWQPNYSSIIGSFASGGVSYLYYPASDRSLSLVVQNSMVRIAEGSVAGIMQEFVLRPLTSVRGKKKQPSTQTVTP
jgi:hypothetical protein